ncbi:MAG: hypothetical protein HYY13_03480 [Nitrospirae bacterium]|nr:hypothetical protein [Nitrospirota bacterium]
MSTANPGILPAQTDGNDVFVELPFMIRGTLRYPPHAQVDAVRAAFDREAREKGLSPRQAAYLKLADVQVLREPMIDRARSAYRDGFLYQIMPLFRPEEIGETDFAALADELYSLPMEGISSFLAALSGAVSIESEYAARGLELSLLSSEMPEGFLKAAYGTFSALLNPETAIRMVDDELSFLNRPGSEYLSGWVRTGRPSVTGLSTAMGPAPFAGGTDTWVRAMPTRQLHITAGNSPAVPIVSALRAFATKSASVIKSPSGALIPGALLGLAMARHVPDHPLTRHTSIVYWQGGDAGLEDVLFSPLFFDRIVVWGAPDAVASVRARALYNRVITFNPRYGVTWIGREAFSDPLEEVAARAAGDSMIWNQKACIASLVHYVEGSEAQALEYARVLSLALREWDRQVTNLVPPLLAGQIRRLRRGTLSQARWFVNGEDGRLGSAVVYVPGEFNLLDHPMCRLVVVRRVDVLERCLGYLHAGVSTVGIHPLSRIPGLRDRIAARGVSNIMPIGQHERMYPGMPHDGMRVLGDLVDWKNA